MFWMGAGGVVAGVGDRGAKEGRDNRKGGDETRACMVGGGRERNIIIFIKCNTARTNARLNSLLNCHQLRV